MFLKCNVFLNYFENSKIKYIVNECYSLFYTDISDTDIF